MEFYLGIFHILTMCLFLSLQTSLMDQDLSLMKQLLMLNEAIEDLKFRRRHSNSSVTSSSCDLSGSNLSVSDTDMFHSGDDENEISRKSLNQVCNTKFIFPEVGSLTGSPKNKIEDEHSSCYDSGCELSPTSP